VNEENAPAMFSPAMQLAPCRMASGVPEAAGLLVLAGGWVPVTVGAVAVPVVVPAAAVDVAAAVGVAAAAEVAAAVGVAVAPFWLWLWLWC